MKVELADTSTTAVSKELVRLRQTGGVVTQGRVLTLVVCTGDQPDFESAIAAANDASREHPCRVIVVSRGDRDAASRLDAEIRVGGDAGASEVIVLALHGPLGDHQASVVIPFLLPDTPVVAWWPYTAPAVPAKDPVGRLARRRLTDSTNAPDPMVAIQGRIAGHTAGDTDLAWARITYWRALLANAVDQVPGVAITAATVSGLAEEPALDLLAGWLASRIDGSVTRTVGDLNVELTVGDTTIALTRPQHETIATLHRTGVPDSLIALPRRDDAECLAEELRRLDPDEIYREALAELTEVHYARS